MPGGGDRDGLHTGAGAEEEDLGSGVEEFKVVGNGDGRVDVAAGAASCKDDAEIIVIIGMAGSG